MDDRYWQNQPNHNAYIYTSFGMGREAASVIARACNAVLNKKNPPDWKAGIAAIATKGDLRVDAAFPAGIERLDSDARHLAMAMFCAACGNMSSPDEITLATHRVEADGDSLMLMHTFVGKGNPLVLGAMLQVAVRTLGLSPLAVPFRRSVPDPETCRKHRIKHEAVSAHEQIESTMDLLGGASLEPLFYQVGAGAMVCAADSIERFESRDWVASQPTNKPVPGTLSRGHQESSGLSDYSSGRVLLPLAQAQADALTRSLDLFSKKRGGTDRPVVWQAAEDGKPLHFSQAFPKSRLSPNGLSAKLAMAIHNTARERKTHPHLSTRFLRHEHNDSGLLMWDEESFNAHNMAIVVQAAVREFGLDPVAFTYDRVKEEGGGAVYCTAEDFTIADAEAWAVSRARALAAELAQSNAPATNEVKHFSGGLDI